MNNPYEYIDDTRDTINKIINKITENINQQDNIRQHIEITENDITQINKK